MMGRTTRLVKKRQRQEETVQLQSNHGQTRTVIPMILLLNKIFPVSIKHPMEALSIGMTCKLAYHWFRTRTEFWEPFLKWLMEKRWEQISNREFANAMRVHYIMWPTVLIESGGVIGVVQSKLLFGSYVSYEFDKLVLVVCRLYPYHPRYNRERLSYCGSMRYIERIPFGEVNYTGNGFVLRKGKKDVRKNASIEYNFWELRVTEYSQKTHTSKQTTFQ